MLKLLTCAQGHFWEVEEAEANGDSTHEINFLPRQVCPTCGSTAESLPDFDLAPSDGALAAPATPPPAPPPPPLRDAEGRPVVSGYEIHEAMGRTPRGVLVYRAKQVFVNRVVTLKVVFGKNDPGQRAWGCLRGEATALGKLLHPNVVQIFEVGERDRQLFYNAVEYVEGPTLAEKVQNKVLTPRQAAQVVETLARAVHAAHEKGVLHRTLKPGSVLVAGKADAPVEQWTLKITDFGLVGRPVEGDVNDLDLQGPLPYYLSPEQAWGRVKDFGPATDVWALGAILYELLAGRPPFVADDWTVLVEKIQGKEAVPPSSIRRRVPVELDAVCRKCLAKSPRRRYATALELADDLRRFLDGYPVKARPASGPQRLVKWAKRRPLETVVVFLAVFVGMPTLTALLNVGGKDNPAAHELAWERAQRFSQETDTLRNRWKDAEQREQQADYFRRILLADRALEAGNEQAVMALLDDCPAAGRQWEWFYLRDSVQHRVAGLPFSRLRTGNRPVSCLAYGSDGHAVAAGTVVEAGGDKKSALHVWNPSNALELVPLKQFNGPVDAVAISPDGSAVATGVGWSPLPGRRGGQISVWRVPDGANRYTVDLPVDRATSLAYSPNGQYLAVGESDGKAALYRAADGLPGLTTENRLRQRDPNETNLIRVAFDSNSERLAVCDQLSPEAFVWNVRTGLNDLPFRASHRDKALCLAYNTDGRLAVGDSDGTVTLSADHYPEATTTFRGHTGPVKSLAFSPDGNRLVTASADKTVKVWDVATGLEILTLKDLPAEPVGVAFSPDGRRLAVAAGTEVRLYGSGQP